MSIVLDIATALCLIAGAAFVGSVSPASAQGYATAVAADGQQIFVGESLNERDPGFVYVYDRQASGWAEAVRLQASDATAGDHFGRALGRTGNQLLSGATVRNESTGAVYVFTKGDDGTWSESQILTASDGVAPARRSAHGAGPVALAGGLAGRHHGPRPAGGLGSGEDRRPAGPWPVRRGAARVHAGVGPRAGPAVHALVRARADAAAPGVRRAAGPHRVVARGAAAAGPPQSSRDPPRPHPGACRSRTTWTSRCSRAVRPASWGSTSRTS